MEVRKKTYIKQETDERYVNDVARVEDADDGGGDPLVERLQHAMDRRNAAMPSHNTA